MRLLAHAEPSHPSALFVLLVQESAQPQFLVAGSQIILLPSCEDARKLRYVYWYVVVGDIYFCTYGAPFERFRKP
ncbi:hypothetical protein BDV11DRAFT_157878 [Aspergillus similis]